MKKEKEERGPMPRGETIRRKIIARLETGLLSAKDLSADVQIAEKEVYGHLDHIRRTLARVRRKFVVVPPKCRKCGFLFTKMERLRKPGKCPQCRAETIQEPLFMIETGR